MGEKTNELIQHDNVRGMSPPVTSGCTILQAAESVGFKIIKGKIAPTLDVSHRRYKNGGK